MLREYRDRADAEISRSRDRPFPRVVCLAAGNRERNDSDPDVARRLAWRRRDGIRTFWTALASELHSRAWTHVMGACEARGATYLTPTHVSCPPPSTALGRWSSP